MILDTTLKVLEIILGSAITTSNCEFTADYVDTVNGTTFAPGGTIGVSNGATLVVAVSSPTASTQRSIRAFTFFNADTVNTTATVRIYDGTNRRRIVTVTLTPGQSLVFTPEAGWSILPSTNGQIPGTVTNDNAAAGCVGEFLEAVTTFGAPVALTTNIAANIAQITVTPGDWDVEGNCVVASSGALTILNAGLSLVSATLPAAERRSLVAGTSVNNGSSSLGRFRQSVNTNTIVYLVGVATFAGTGSGSGFINARRIR